MTPIKNRYGYKSDCALLAGLLNYNVIHNEDYISIFLNNSIIKNKIIINNSFEFQQILETSFLVNPFWNLLGIHQFIEI